MKYKVFTLLLVLTIVSCQKSNKNVANTVEHSELLKLADSLELKQTEYDDLIDSVNTLNKKSDLFYRKIHLQKKEIGKLSSENKRLLNENRALSNKSKKPVLTRAEKIVQNLIFNMHKAWANMVKTKDTKELMKFFHPKYLISRISIDTDDKASVSRFSNADFEEYIKESILNVDGLSVEFDDVDVLDIEVKDESYFNIVYKCAMGTYKNDRLTATNSLLVTITGKNINGAWGISSYSWVNFKYGE